MHVGQKASFVRPSTVWYSEGITEARRYGKIRRPGPVFTRRPPYGITTITSSVTTRSGVIAEIVMPVHGPIVPEGGMTDTITDGITGTILMLGAEYPDPDSPANGAPTA